MQLYGLFEIVEEAEVVAPNESKKVGVEHAALINVMARLKMHRLYQKARHRASSGGMSAVRGDVSM